MLTHLGPEGLRQQLQKPAEDWKQSEKIRLLGFRFHTTRSSVGNMCHLTAKRPRTSSDMPVTASACGRISMSKVSMQGDGCQAEDRLLQEQAG